MAAFDKIPRVATPGDLDLGLVTRYDSLQKTRAAAGLQTHLNAVPGDKGGSP